jgi:lipid-A-disaccharide synthase
MKKNVLVVAGETSGDMHAAKVVELLKKQCPDLQFWGIGGDKLIEQGVEIIQPIDEMDVVGIVEVLKKYPFFRQIFDKTLAEVEKRKPDLVFTVDYPGFNMRLAKKMHARGIKVCHYVCPQVWAWHRGRIPRIAAILDRLFVIFPFEVDIFKDYPLKADFVGHPLAEELRAYRKQPDRPLPWPAKRKVALLPGSRRAEVELILPELIEAAFRFEQQNPDTGFMIAAAPKRVKLIERVLSDCPNKPANLAVVPGEVREILKQADAALVASGTATLETALMRCPLALVYKATWLNYQIAKRLIKIPWLGIANIVAGREVHKEFLQYDCTADHLAAELDRILNDDVARAEMLKSFDWLDHHLGDQLAEENIACLLAEELGIN